MAAALSHGQGSETSRGSVRSSDGSRNVVSVNSQPLLDLIQNYRKNPLLQISKYLTSGQTVLIRMEYESVVRWNPVQLVGRVPSTNDVFHVESKKMDFKRIVRLPLALPG